MRWVHDNTGRFDQRPYYPQAELDAICERVMEDFQKRRRGGVLYPVSTDDLTCLIEEIVDDLDPYADLSQEGADVEGITLFQPGGQARIKISKALASDPRREVRFRSSLTHELIHALLHNPLFARVPSRGQRAGSADSCAPQACKPTDTSPSGDWMEWQARYGSGALLIPVRAMFRIVVQFHKERRLESGPIAAGSVESNELIRRVVTTFQTSEDVGRLRLVEEGVIIPTAPLFDMGIAPKKMSSGLVHCSEILPGITAPLGLRVEFPSTFDEGQSHTNGQSRGHPSRH